MNTGGSRIVKAERGKRYSLLPMIAGNTTSGLGHADCDPKDCISLLASYVDSEY